MRIVDQAVSLEGYLVPAPGLEVDPLASPGAQVIERAARTCYQTEGRIGPGSAGKLIGHLRRKGHAAMLEFGAAVVRIVTDRGVSHELVRHRLASYAQESSRFCRYDGEQFGREIAVIRQPFRTEAAPAIWEAACRAAEAAYLELLEVGEAPDLARSVLPTCLKTEVVAQMNYRQWRYVRHLRSRPNVHPLMRQVIGLLSPILEVISPEVFTGDQESTDA